MDTTTQTINADAVTKVDDTTATVSVSTTVSADDLFASLQALQANDVSYANQLAQTTTDRAANQAKIDVVTANLSTFASAGIYPTGQAPE